MILSSFSIKMFLIDVVALSRTQFSCRSKAPGGHLVSVHNTKANGDMLCIVIKYSPHNLRIWIGAFEFFQANETEVI